MTAEITIRKAGLKDAQTIAALVNRFHPHQAPLERIAVAERFSEVGFLLAETGQKTVGMLGWQVENLVIRVMDFLLTPDMDKEVAGGALIEAMENEGEMLQAEVVVLFLPPNPAQDLITYWENFGYAKRPIADLPKSWREVSYEWDDSATQVMIKQLRENMIRRPM